MKIENIDVNESIDNIKKQLALDKSISPAMKSSIDLLILIVGLLGNRLQINSKNSSKPPSQDPNRLRKTRMDKGLKRGKKKQGGQVGHVGSTLVKIDSPNEIEEILINRKSIPVGTYKRIGFDTRQVFNIKISTHVIEYRAEVLEDKKGNQYVAKFPENVSKSVQYGNEVKAQSVYMSQFQLIPLARVSDYFNDQLKLAISKGSISNFNREAFEKLENFETWAKEQLLKSPFNHADETGINLSGSRIWLHNLSNSKVTLYHADEERGSEAMNRMGILPFYVGILCHDHWKPYYKYSCTHALCNAHHLRELTFAFEEDAQKWAKKMYDLLEKINNEVNKSKSAKLSPKKIKKYQKIYRTILSKGKLECPYAEKTEVKQGRTKKSKSRNLLERLIDFEDDTLMFMKVSVVSFTNNQGENDLRMTKVQQKISGCFRSMEGAQIFCRVRSYLVTCRKNGVSPTEALRLLFQGELPSFIK
jgi:transposase